MRRVGFRPTGRVLLGVGRVLRRLRMQVFLALPLGNLKVSHSTGCQVRLPGFGARVSACVEVFTFTQADAPRLSVCGRPLPL